MEITAGFHTRHTAWRPWSAFRGFPCRPTFCQTSSWVVRLDIRSAASPCFGNSCSLPAVRRFVLLLAIVALMPGALLAQLTTGAIEGTLRAPDGRPMPDSPILITGGAGFRAVIHSNSNGEVAITLPYGRYRLSGEVQHGAAASAATIFVAPLQTVRFDLVMDTSGSMRTLRPAPARTPGMWTDATSAHLYPEAFSLAGLLLSREPASVTEPLDFTGLSDNRLAVASQRGFSWTDTQYKLQGMDATDSYQPGLPAVLPDVQALDEVVVRSAFAEAASSGADTEVGLFLAEPDVSLSESAAWHGALSTANTGAALSSTNLPLPDSRGLVHQADRFRWFTRDGLEIGGPLARWADFYASGSGQWASQA